MPAGRPTKYKPEYCQKLLDWVESYPVKTGDQVNAPPFLSKFAREQLGVSRSTIYKWAEDNPEFSDAIKRYDEVYAEFIQENALLGHYNASFSIFAAKNRMGWRDKQDVEVSGGLKILKADKEDQEL